MYYHSCPTRASPQRAARRPPTLLLYRARLVSRGRRVDDGARPPAAPRASPASPSSPDPGAQQASIRTLRQNDAEDDDDGRLFTVELEAQDAARALAWTLAPLPPSPSQNNNDAAQVLVERVSPGSEAEAMGIRSGDRLRALSDPVRESEMWEVGARPSLSRIRDAMRYRRAATLRLVLERPPQTAAAARQAASPSSSSRPAPVPVSSAESTLGSLLGTRDDDDEAARSQSPSAQQQQRPTTPAMTIGERMAAQQAAADKASRALSERQERRREYLGAQGGGGGGGGGAFLLGAAAAFVLPAAVILAVAYSQGLLDPGRFVSPD